jgi:hypothetical protein
MEPALEHEQEIAMKLMTSLKHASMISLLAVGCASVATAQTQQDPRLAQLADAAGCEFPEVPTIPAAEGATMEQMVATQGAIQAYMGESEVLLACLGGIAQNAELTEEDRQLALDAYNAEVTHQETLAENWNVQRTAFLEMQEQ